jgi:hypothetical protein
MADQDGKEEERPDPQRDDAEVMARLRAEIENLPVSEHVAYMMHSLSTLAIGRLGLTADTVGRRDLGQARLAIDAFKALLAVLEPVLPAGEGSAHRGMLSQLQLAYAGASGRDDSSEAVDSPAAHKEETTQEAAGGKEGDGPKKPPANRKPRGAVPKKASTVPKKASTVPKKAPTVPKKTSKPRKSP